MQVLAFLPHGVRDEYETGWVGVCILPGRVWWWLRICVCSEGAHYVFHMRGLQVRGGQEGRERFSYARRRDC